MPYDDEDKPRRPQPEDLGSGGAQRAASKAEARKAEQCKQIYGGMYDFASGKCKNKQYD